MIGDSGGTAAVYIIGFLYYYYYYYFSQDPGSNKLKDRKIKSMPLNWRNNEQLKPNLQINNTVQGVQTGCSLRDQYSLQLRKELAK